MSPPFKIVAASCGIALTLVGCSSAPPEKPTQSAPAVARPDPRASAAPLLDDVLHRIGELGGAHTEVRGDLGVLGEFTGKGVVSYADSEADLDVDGNLRMARGNDQHPVTMTVVDGIGYVKSPLTHSKPDKPWLRISPKDNDATAKLLGPALTQVRAASDPRTAFAGVEKATKIQTRSRDQVDGIPTTRYELRVVTSLAAQHAQDPTQRARLRKAAEGGQPELTYQLWIDDDGRPLRFSANSDVEKAGEIALTSNYRDWGTVEAITAPPENKIDSFSMGQPPR